MNEKEIITALENCTSGSPCKLCPSLHKAHCMTDVMEEALDLIKRQQEEIEKLKNSRDRWKQLAKDFDEASREEEKEVERGGNDDR